MPCPFICVRNPKRGVIPPAGGIDTPVNIFHGDPNQQLGAGESLKKLDSLLNQLGQSEQQALDPLLGSVGDTVGDNDAEPSGPDGDILPSPSKEASAEKPPANVFQGIFDEALKHLKKLVISAEQTPELQGVVDDTGQKMEAVRQLHLETSNLQDVQGTLQEISDRLKALEKGESMNSNSGEPLQIALRNVLKGLVKDLDEAQMVTDSIYKATNQALKDHLRVTVHEMDKVLGSLPTAGEPSASPGGDDKSRPISGTREARLDSRVGSAPPLRNLLLLASNNRRPGAVDTLPDVFGDVGMAATKIVEGLESEVQQLASDLSAAVRIVSKQAPSDVKKKAKSEAKRAHAQLVSMARVEAKRIMADLEQEARQEVGRLESKMRSGNLQDPKMEAMRVHTGLVMKAQAEAQHALADMQLAAQGETSRVFALLPLGLQDKAHNTHANLQSRHGEPLASQKPPSRSETIRSDVAEIASEMSSGAQRLGAEMSSDAKQIGSEVMSDLRVEFKQLGEDIKRGGADSQTEAPAAGPHGLDTDIATAHQGLHSEPHALGSDSMVEQPAGSKPPHGLHSDAVVTPTKPSAPAHGLSADSKAASPSGPSQVHDLHADSLAVPYRTASPGHHLRSDKATAPPRAKSPAHGLHADRVTDPPWVDSPGHLLRSDAMAAPPSAAKPPHRLGDDK